MANTYPNQPPLTHRIVTVQMAAIETAKSVWVVPGFRGHIKRISSVIDGAITVANAAITVEIGGTAVTGAALTIAFTGSAAGTVDTAVVPPSSTNRFDSDDAIEIITDGGPTAGATAVFTLELEAV